MRTHTTDLRGDKIIDSRDAIARSEELEGYRDSAIEEASRTPEEGETIETWTAQDGTVYGVIVDWSEDEEEEYRALKGLEEEASQSPDWRHGETLIRDDYFQEYAEELAEDIGAVNRNATWPNNFIDWEAAADALKQDYMSVTFGDLEYWIRA